MKFKRDGTKKWYFAVQIIIGVELFILYRGITGHFDGIFTNSVLVTMVSTLVTLTSLIWNSMRMEMNDRDRKIVDDMYNSKPYLLIEQKSKRAYSIIIKNIGNGPLFNLRINCAKSKFNKLFDFIPKDGFNFPLNLDKINDYSFDLYYRNATKNFTDNFVICFNYENEFGDKFEECVRIQVDNGRVITMSDKPILNAFHDSFYFLDVNDYIDK